MNINLIAPAGTTVGTIVQTISGGNRTVDTNGVVSVDTRDAAALLGAGYVVASPLYSASADIGANGVPATVLPLLDGFNSSDGSPIAAAAAAAKFGVTITPGTSFFLIGESAQGNTKTDKVGFLFAVPQSYVAAQNLTVTINAEWDGAGTAGATKTIDCEVFKQSNAGVSAADICATAAQTITAAAVDYAFTITGATLSPGDVVLIQVTAALQETGGASGLTARVNSVRVA